MNAKPSPKNYDRYLMTIKVRDRIYGGTPKNPVAFGFNNEPPEEGAYRRGFPHDETGWFIWDRQIRAGFKEAAHLSQLRERIRGCKQFMMSACFLIYGSDHKHRIYAKGYEPSRELPLELLSMHLAGKKSPVIYWAQYMVTPIFEFEVWSCRDKPGHLNGQHIRDLLTDMKERGLGAARNQGHGKFDVIRFVTID